MASMETISSTKKNRDATEERRSRLWRENCAVLMPDSPNKDIRSRLSFYIDWLSERGLTWYQPDLNAYRDYLLFDRTRTDKRGQRKPATLSAATVQSRPAHLATIRSRYNALLTRSNEARDLLFELANPEDSEVEQQATW